MIKLTVLPESTKVKLTAGTDSELRFKADSLINIGTNDYDKLKNRPQINEITLTGNKSFESLGLVEATKLEIESILQS